MASSGQFIKYGRYYPKPRCAILSNYRISVNINDPFAQTPQAQLMNNFISGSIGGFVGTALNTP